MTKGEYIDFVRNSLQMVDKTMKYHPEQVSAAINMAVNTVFWEMYEKNPKVMRKSMERYSQVAFVDPSQAVGDNRFKVTLSADVVDLPRKAGGILEILAYDNGIPSEITSTTTEYVPVSVIEGAQLYGSESSLPSNVCGYSWDGARTIEFWQENSDIGNGVDVRYIQQFKSYSLTDNVLLPYGQDVRIIDLVRQYLGAIPPKDLVNDEADMQR